MKINSESTCFDIDFIRRVEKMYKAKYIYETELIEYGPVGAIFYQEDPPNNYSNWMAVYYDSNRKGVMITSASEVVKQPVRAIMCAEDDWIYSHYTHHFYTKNGMSIDGGRSYTRIIAKDLDNIKKANFIPTKDGLVML